MPTRDAEAAGMPAIKEDTDVRLLQVPVEPEFNSRIISYVEVRGGRRAGLKSSRVVSI